MIAYRDFKPKVLGWLSKAKEKEENERVALAEANGWIVSESIDVMNVETIGVGDSLFETGTIRIWYRSAGVKPRSFPEG